MPPRTIKQQLTCPIEFTSGSSLIGRTGILVIPRNHLVVSGAYCRNLKSTEAEAKVMNHQRSLDNYIKMDSNRATIDFREVKEVLSHFPITIILKLTQT